MNSRRAINLALLSPEKFTNILISNLYLNLCANTCMFIIKCTTLHCSKTVLNEYDNIEDGIGVPDWKLTLALLFSWTTIFLVIVRGVRSSGKAAYFLALFPYVIMIALLIRGATLEGAGKGVLYFVEPKWEELLNPKVSHLFKLT